MTNQEQEQQEEQMVHVSVGAPCFHKHIMSPSKLYAEIKKGDKAVKRSPLENNRAHILCEPCYRREDKASCSINPFREVTAITAMPAAYKPGKRILPAAAGVVKVADADIAYFTCSSSSFFC